MVFLQYISMFSQFEMEVYNIRMLMIEMDVSLNNWYAMKVETGYKKVWRLPLYYKASLYKRFNSTILYLASLKWSFAMSECRCLHRLPWNEQQLKL